MQLLALGDFKVLSCESGIASLSLQRARPALVTGNGLGPMCQTS